MLAMGEESVTGALGPRKENAKPSRLPTTPSSFLPNTCSYALPAEPSQQSTTTSTHGAESLLVMLSPRYFDGDQEPWSGLMRDIDQTRTRSRREGFANPLIHINGITEDTKGLCGGAEGESEAAKGAARSKLVQRRSVLGRSPTSQEVLKVSTHSMPAHSNAATLRCI